MPSDFFSSHQILGLCGLALGLIALLGGLTVAITSILTIHSRKKLLAEMEATLKMEMIERGMAADEIERVLAARISANNPTLPWWDNDGRYALARQAAERKLQQH